MLAIKREQKRENKSGRRRRIKKEKINFMTKE